MVRERGPAGSRGEMSDVLDELEAVVWEADPWTFAFKYVSRGAEALLGYPAQAWLDDPAFWRHHLHPEDRAAAVALCETAVRLGMDHDFEYRMIASDGATRWVRDVVKVGRDERGEVVRLRGVLYDRTAIHRLREALLESEERHRAVIETIPAAVVLLAPDGRIMSVNRVARDRLDYSRADVEGRQFVELVHPDDRERTAALIRAEPELGAAESETRVRDGSGAHVPLVLSAARLGDRSGGSSLLALHLHERTDRTCLEGQLRRAARLETVGRLSAGIAHDFNNVLTIIGSYLDLLIDEAQPPVPRADDVLQLRSAVARGARLTRQLLSLGRHREEGARLIDLNETLRDIHALIQRAVGSAIELRTELSADPVRVRIDASQLEHMIINLALNARDAMPEGGTIFVRTALVTADTASRQGARPRSTALLVVRDTGTGMDSETLRRIFEPFFTTKGSGRGTGLGLATARGFVHQAGGTIEVHSAPGLGTTFEIRFPAAEEPSG